MTKKEINNAIVDALVRYMPESSAKLIVRAIVLGEIPNVSITY